MGAIIVNPFGASIASCGIIGVGIASDGGAIVKVRTDQIVEMVGEG